MVLVHPMKINYTLLDDLTEQAKSSSRLRMNYDLRNSMVDQSQRMLNAIEPGSVIPVHRHRNTSETVVVIRGKAVELLFDETGHIVKEKIEMSSDGPCFGVNVPKGQWHTLQSLMSGTVIMEVKDGVYEPVQKEDVLQ